MVNAENPVSTVDEAWLELAMQAYPEFAEVKGYTLSDPRCIVLYFHIPESQVNFFQGHFELYEGLGLVRTLSIRDSLVCVLTTPECLSDCLLALRDMRKTIRWTAAPRPTLELQHRYLGYFKNASDHS